MYQTFRALNRRGWMTSSRLKAIISHLFSPVGSRPFIYCLMQAIAFAWGEREGKRGEEHNTELESGLTHV